MRGRENIVPDTGVQRLYLVNRRANCAREREYCPRYREAEAVPGRWESKLCKGERILSQVRRSRGCLWLIGEQTVRGRENIVPRYRGAEAVPGK